MKTFRTGESFAQQQREGKWKSREKIGPTYRLGFGCCRGILGDSFGDRLMAENGIAFKSWLSVWSSETQVMENNTAGRKYSFGKI